MQNRRFNIHVDDQYIWINGKAIPKQFARILGYALYAAIVFLAVLLAIFVLLPLLGIVLAFILVLALLGAAVMLGAPLYQSFSRILRSVEKNRSSISKRNGN